MNTRALMQALADIRYQVNARYACGYVLVTDAGDVLQCRLSKGHDGKRHYDDVAERWFEELEKWANEGER